jgi:cell volume regulation protein A
VPIILALFPLLAGLEHAETFFNAAFFVVLVSLVVQGWTVAPAARILGLEIPPRPSAIQREQLDLPGQYNYELVGYKLTQESPALHRLPARLALPKPVKLATIIRQGEILDAGEISTLEENDYVFLFARAEDLPALDRLFTAVHAPARLEEQRFFGELVLNADASMAEIADFYSLTLDPDDRARTLEDFLVRIFRQPVVGDRVRVSRLEFVIREMEGRHILKVGLKLIPE